MFMSSLLPMPLVEDSQLAMAEAADEDEDDDADAAAAAAEAGAMTVVGVASSGLPTE